MLILECAEFLFKRKWHWQIIFLFLFYFYEKANDKKSTTPRTNKEQDALNSHKRLKKWMKADSQGLFEGTDAGCREFDALLLSFRGGWYWWGIRRREPFFFNFCVLVGIMSRIFVRHRITHDDPTTWPFPYPSEAIAPDSEISIFVIIIVKEADALILFINFASATRLESMIKALKEASSTILSISPAAITFLSHCFLRTFSDKNSIHHVLDILRHL